VAREREKEKKQAADALSPATTEWRGRFVLGCFVAAFLILFLRAVDLQVLDRDFLTNEGAKRHVRTLEVPGGRGAIRDRRGQPLALSAPVESVWAVPGEVLKAEKQLPQLAKKLGVKHSLLRKELKARADKNFMYLRRQMNPADAREVLALGLPGVFLQREYRRYYPAGEAAAQLVGITNIDIDGQEGMELAMETRLRGENGRRRVVKDRVGRVVDDLAGFKPARAGEDVLLSIDLRLQYQAYREIKAAVAQHHARGGTAVVLNPHSGEVLAMVSYPSFNPNRRVAGQRSGLRNRPATDLFEPGSTVKPLVVARAIEAGLYNGRSLIPTYSGVYRVGRLTVRDVHDCGTVTLATLLTKSSNVGAAQVGLTLGRERLWRGLHEFGFGETTGSAFPGEGVGVLRDHRQWGEIATATASYGYGFSVTALQLARAYGVIATDGLLQSLSLERVDVQPAGKRVLTDRTARVVRQYLEGVVAPGGTAIRAAVPSYRVAGKTGTVHKAVSGGYSADDYQSLFVGMAPASRPQLVALVMIDEPSGKDYYGGLVAAPVFARIMQDALRTLQIPPDVLGVAQSPVADGNPS
jgi:cell division protein FtsI (penicillin-binding protein 3)